MPRTISDNLWCAIFWVAVLAFEITAGVTLWG